MGSGYIGFERLYVFTLCSAFFVMRTKENIRSSGATRILWTRRLVCNPIRRSS
jgi:hypothetical protein